MMLKGPELILHMPHPLLCFLTPPFLAFLILLDLSVHAPALLWVLIPGMSKEGLAQFGVVVIPVGVYVLRALYDRVLLGGVVKVHPVGAIVDKYVLKGRGDMFHEPPGLAG